MNARMPKRLNAYCATACIRIVGMMPAGSNGVFPVAYYLLCFESSSGQSGMGCAIRAANAIMHSETGLEVVQVGPDQGSSAWPQLSAIAGTLRGAHLGLRSHSVGQRENQQLFKTEPIRERHVAGRL